LQSDLRIGVHTEEGRTVVTLDGELDLASCQTLERAIEEARELAPEVVIVDLSDLRFIDMSGLRVLLREHQRLERDGKQLALINVGEHAMRLLRLTHLNAVLRLVNGPEGLCSGV
jgi:anti-anti-sigma factor